MRILKKAKSTLHKLFNYIKKIYLRLLGWIKRSGPGKKARKGSLIGIFCVMLLLMAYNYSDLRTGYGLAVDILVGVLIGVISGQIGRAHV